MINNIENFKNNFSKKKYRDVFIFQGDDGYSLTKQCLGNIEFDFSSLRDKKVLIKPNAGRLVVPHSGINTNPEVVAAIIDFFVDKGINNIAVAESPILGVKALEALEKCGIAKIAQERKIPLIDLDVQKPEIISIPKPKVIDKLKVCKEILNYDFIVSVPVVKTHMHTQVSLGLKNMKGCLYRREKVRLHQLPSSDKVTPPAKPLDIAIADLAKILLPNLTIIDGTIAQEGLGPSAGTPKQFGVVISSLNCLAADYVCAELMGLNPLEIHHLRYAIKEVFDDNDADLFFKEKLQIKPNDYMKWMEKFEPPPQKISIEFSNVVVEDIESCSACLSSVLMFLRRYEKALNEYYSDSKQLRIALGKGIGEQPSNTLLVGNCTAHRKSGCILVKGCPPVASDILRTLEKNLK